MPNVGPSPGDGGGGAKSENDSASAQRMVHGAFLLLQNVLPQSVFLDPNLLPLWNGCQLVMAGRVSSPATFAWVLRNLAKILVNNLGRSANDGNNAHYLMEARDWLKASISFVPDLSVQQQLQHVENLLGSDQSQSQSKMLTRRGYLLHDAKRWAESQAAFAKAFELDPSAADALFMYLYSSYRCADWGDISDVRALARSVCKSTTAENSEEESPLTALRQLSLSSEQSDALPAATATTPLPKGEAHSWTSLLQQLTSKLQAHYDTEETPAGLLGHPWILTNFVVSPKIQLKVAKTFAKAMEGVANYSRVTEVTTQFPPLVGKRDSKELRAARQGWIQRQKAEPLRVGFVSADFHQKATLYLCVESLVQMFRQASRAVVDEATGRRTELFIFATTPANGSAWREKLQKAAGDLFFVDLSSYGQNHKAMAAEIRTFDIDILIDMDGYSNEGIAVRSLFATRLAPITATWFVYIATTGQENIDYIIADENVLPPHVAVNHSERPFYMTPPFFPISHATLFSDTEVLDSVEENNKWRQRYGLGRVGEQFIFASFNKHLKITPHVWESWMLILERVPNSVLLLLENPKDSIPNFRKYLAQSGLAPSRLKFCPFVNSSEEHIHRVAMVDVILDTPPWGAHTGAADALWCAVPVVTTPNPTWDAPADGSMQTMASRVALSLLRSVGIDSLIGRNLLDYTNIAVKLAEDSAWRADLVSQLKESRSKALFSASTYATKFLRGLHQMYAEVAASVVDAPQDTGKAAADV